MSLTVQQYIGFYRFSPKNTQIFLKEQIGLNRFSPGFYVSTDPKVVPVCVRLEQNGEKTQTSC